MISTDRLKATSTDHLAGAFNPRDSDDAIALGSARSVGPAQRWDNRGRAVDETGVYGGEQFRDQRPYEPAIPARTYDGNGEAHGGMDGYAPYDPYAAYDGSQEEPARYPPQQPQSSRSPLPQTPRVRSTSPPQQPSHVPIQQPSYPPAQQPAYPAQQRYQLYDRPVPHLQEQESTVGSYRTAYDGR
ncbi:hypothetical protein FRC08_000519 [Ceratobasidium sp. 394]|nr:hypothetical protein FRC08_000519 [Ceratobasidium sp. 394]